MAVNFYIILKFLTKIDELKIVILYLFDKIYFQKMNDFVKDVENYQLIN